MRTIDSHDGSDHRIGQPTECPGCGAKELGSMDTLGDSMATDISFACGAEVRWRSVGHAGPEGVRYSESLVEVKTCPSSLSAVIAKARAAYPDLRLGQLLWNAAWLIRGRRDAQQAGTVYDPNPNIVFYIDDETLAEGLDMMVTRRGILLPGDEASQTAERIRSYLARKVGASLDGETVDHVAKIIRGD